MRQLAVAICGSVLTGAYWWIVFTIVYADVLFEGDRNPALQPPSDRETLIWSGVTIVLGVLIYAVLSVLWRRLTTRVQRTT